MSRESVRMVLGDVILWDMAPGRDMAYGIVFAAAMLAVIAATSYLIPVLLFRRGRVGFKLVAASVVVILVFAAACALGYKYQVWSGSPAGR